MASLDWQSSQIRQLFAEVLAAAQASRIGFMNALVLKGRLFDAASGKPATALQVLGFKELVGRVAADGILTEGEHKELAAWLAANGLTLDAPVAGGGPVDLDTVQLPDL